MTRAAVLWTLLCLFALRVTGQLLVVLEVAPWLPPMDEWQSGLLPYPVLLFTQVIILVVLATVSAQFSRRRGYLVRHNRRLGGALWVAGWVYACSMVVRYVVTMSLRPEKRWTGDLIPIVFHLVLASFLLTVAGHHRRSGLYDHP
jgi:uncharacterized protein